ncbi:cyclin-A2 isoform X4 [Zea mays]|uniref:cyclin-A2 isoform X4 n=1 Tax=Zea mays TaxID=4577 RepID=UPI0009AA1359|nr:cyclin-A2 isoform X4 [Zea mays]|eukprot:XP_020400692.1 cyclin-A2 isoform X4 [Zea mays]
MLNPPPLKVYMAARKKKPLLIACQATSARITRSQAAANSTRSGLAPSVPVPLKTEHNHAAKKKMKREASDENASADAGASAPLPKRRTVLKNVTNISCAKISKRCTAVTGLKLGPSQKAGQSINKQCTNKISMLLPLAVGGSSLVDDSNNAEETQMVDLLAQKEKQIVLLKEAQPLQNTEQNKGGACDEASVEERNAMNVHETAALKAGVSNGLNIVDIDKNNGDPQMCVTYVAEIYRNLMASEVSDEYKLVADTLYLTVYLIDQFLSQNCIQTHKLQLLGITSMLIASKYEEYSAPSAEEFCNITAGTYAKAEVLEMEQQVLNDLGFHLSVPTTNTFLRRFLRAAQASRTRWQHLRFSLQNGHLTNLTILGTLLLSTTRLTKASILELACGLYRNCSTTPVIAPSTPSVRSMGSRSSSALPTSGHRSCCGRSSVDVLPCTLLIHSPFAATILTLYKIFLQFLFHFQTFFSLNMHSVTWVTDKRGATH